MGVKNQTHEIRSRINGSFQTELAFRFANRYSGKSLNGDGPSRFNLRVASASCCVSVDRKYNITIRSTSLYHARSDSNGSVQ